MNKKITFPELTEAVAATTGTSKRTSELFLKELFAVITSALVGGENVKIKNFGQFKLTEVNERKSVNVNTGEEMKIPSHTKVTFTPDKALADAINMPFAGFEAVEIGDSATDEDLEVLSSLEDITPAPEAAKTEEIVAKEQQLQPEETKAEELPPAEQPEETKAEELPPAEQPEETKEEELPQQEEIVEDDEEADDESEEIASNQQERSEGLHELRARLADKYSAPYRNRMFLRGFFWGFVMMLVVAAVAFYSYYLYNEDRRIYLEALAFSLQQQPAEDQQPTVAEEPRPVIEQQEEPTVSTPEEPEPEPDPAPVAEPVAAPEPDPEPSAEVKYDTVRSNRYLTTMSREHYGDFRFWVYIYEENKAKIDDPNAIPPGTVLVIPPPEKYGIDKDDEASINRARARAVEILNAHGSGSN